MARIGIMGGTFNPVHNVHLIMAEEARRQFQLKKVLFMPTGALLSKTSFNEGLSVPGIAHAVVIESL